MLPSGLSELHSCKEKVHEASCCGHGKIILIFLIAEYVFKIFNVPVVKEVNLIFEIKNTFCNILLRA